jgi:Kef-type K+ transport system membrane component KefB
MVHLFLGATLCATSVGITARVLRDLGQVQRTEAQIILGAAVIDDVIGLVVLAVISGLISASASGAAPRPEAILIIVLKAAVFLVGAVVIGGKLSRRLFKLASFLSAQHVLLVTSLGFCFLLARLAAAIDLSPIVGAFAAGLILEPADYQDFRERGEHRIEDVLRPIGGFLVPVFFVVAGMHVDLRALAHPQALGLSAALLAAAVLGKQACALGVRGKGLDRLSVGIGMVPRGEVGLIFANAGRTLLVAAPAGGREPLVSATSFAALVIAVIATALITPPLLHWSLSRTVPRAAPEAA